MIQGPTFFLRKKKIQNMTSDFIYFIRVKTCFHFLFAFPHVATIMYIVSQLCLSKTLKACPPKAVWPCSWQSTVLSPNS